MAASAFLSFLHILELKTLEHNCAVLFWLLYFL